VDVRYFAIKHLGMNQTHVESGTLEIPFQQLAGPEALSISSFDKCGRLRSESYYWESIRYLSRAGRRDETVDLSNAGETTENELHQSDDPAVEMKFGDRSIPADLSRKDRAERLRNVSRERLRNISREYAQLRNSYANQSGTEREYNYCTYKYMDYGNRRRICEIGERVFWSGVLTAAATVAAFLVLFCFDPVDWHQAGALAIPLLYAGVLQLGFGSETIESACICILKSALKWALGYGVRLRRVLTTGFVLTSLFACVYLVASRFGEHIGYVAQDNHNVLKGTPCEPVPLPLAAGRSLYFSAVTFTTLGYGDYQPRGRLQLLCAAEAFIGAAMIAMVTVVLARRYLSI
jgi:hypothetical protein